MKKLLIAALAIVATGVYAQDERALCSCGEVCACDPCSADNYTTDEEIDVEIEYAPEKKKKNCARMFVGMDYGFIGLDGENGVMQIRKGHSIGVSTSMGVRFHLNQKKTAGKYSMWNSHYSFAKNSLMLDLGVRTRWDNYVFDDKMTLAHDGTAVAIDPKYKKSKLTTFSLDLPVTLNYKPARHVTFAAGVYGGVLINSHTKIKFPRHKDSDDFGLNEWQAGATARVKVGPVGVFVNYSFTPLFENGDCRPFTVGFCL